MGKAISCSVGAGGVNLAHDTVTVQFLLNCVPDADGGPVVELVMDGLVGPKTTGAISHFQRMRLGFMDGRVDPEIHGGKTIVELNKHDPTPTAPPISPQIPPRIPPLRRTGRKGRKKITIRL